jgi:hypothetical protein
MAGLNQSIGRGFRRIPVLCILLGLILVAPFRASPPSADPPPGPIVCEPRPPLDFQVILEEFAPAAQGGIARIRIAVTPRTGMGGILISGRLLHGMRFSDGSTERSWQLTIPTGSEQSFTEEIQIPDDGMRVIALEADSSLANGRPVHRSQGIRVYAGIEPPSPRKRGRALEFQGQIQGEPLP